MQGDSEHNSTMFSGCCLDFHPVHNLGWKISMESLKRIKLTTYSTYAERESIMAYSLHRSANQNLRFKLSLFSRQTRKITTTDGCYHINRRVVLWKTSTRPGVSSVVAFLTQICCRTISCHLHFFNRISILYVDKLLFNKLSLSCLWALSPFFVYTFTPRHAHAHCLSLSLSPKNTLL